jgi:hypothetical protein
LAVVDRLLSHDGSPALARHVADAVLKEDSGRQIDAAAAPYGHDRAAVLAGDRGPNIYV